MRDFFGTFLRARPLSEFSHGLDPKRTFARLIKPLQPGELNRYHGYFKLG
jgi:hypothetical protein